MERTPEDDNQTEDVPTLFMIDDLNVALVTSKQQAEILGIEPTDPSGPPLLVFYGSGRQLPPIGEGEPQPVYPSFFLAPDAVDKLTKQLAEKLVAHSIVELTKQLAEKLVAHSIVAAAYDQARKSQN